jgi:hypothetical protein
MKSMKIERRLRSVRVQDRIDLFAVLLLFGQWPLTFEHTLIGHNGTTPMDFEHVAVADELLLVPASSTVGSHRRCPY